MTYGEMSAMAGSWIKGMICRKCHHQAHMGRCTYEVTRKGDNQKAMCGCKG